ncbi:hypothetical protein BKA70DRAFT_1231144 [Coprinopsis sp. MPI-PUGE-AT-0042]|nr:hypothetical protein BKA70DRAFT_1231144 [Coprinopsis sp. MPI-PUGE-AT-0042]
MLSTSRLVLAVTATLAATANAHMAVFHQAMWCLNGNTGQENYNSYDIVNPLYQLPFNKWWFHAVDRCNEFPPAPGVFLDLPAGGSFMAEIAENRAKTSQSYNSRDASDWPDGGRYPDNHNDPNCIVHPNLHAQNESMAAGTAFAISYNVRPDNLVVFSVRHRTPWKRVVWYDVPAAMPACPPEGCICAWGWVPNGCWSTQHGATSTTPVAAPQPPVWCEGNPDACTKGAKQMVYWNQAEGNNIYVDGFDNSGGHKSPGYNGKCGFWDGAQNDIFVGAPSSGGGQSPAQPNDDHGKEANDVPAPAPAPAPSPESSPETAPAPAPAPAAPSPQANAPSSSPAAASPSNTGSTSPQAQNDTRPNSPAPQSETHSSAPRPRCPAGHRRRKSTGETVEKRLLKTHHARKPVTW